MSEVYVLVKQVDDRKSEGHFTIHGVTEDDGIAGTWSAAGDSCYSLWFETDKTPSADAWVPEEETDE